MISTHTPRMKDAGPLPSAVKNGTIWRLACSQTERSAKRETCGDRPFSRSPALPFKVGRKGAE